MNQIKTETQQSLLNRTELAKQLGVSVVTIHRLMSDRQIPYIRVRGLPRFQLAAVLSALAVRTSSDVGSD